MGKTAISGIGGVLGELISDNPQKPRPTQQATPTTPEKSPKQPHARNRARTGRPPGKGMATPTRREKLTVRIDADLVAAYRDWSWDARCNLGELVSLAMRNHLRSRRDS